MVAKCQAIASETGAALNFESVPERAVAGADVSYTDVWVSMGETDAVWEEHIREVMPYQVNMKLMKTAGSQCRFMHCLPAFHDLETTIGTQIYDRFGIDCIEVTDEVFQSEQSIVFDKAEKRVHTLRQSELHPIFIDLKFLLVSLSYDCVICEKT